MTDSTPRKGSTMNRTTTLITGVVVIFIATLGTIVALAFAVEDGARMESLVGLILPATGTLLVTLLALDKVAKVDEKIDRVGQQTTDLTNGLLDAKVRAAVADVLAPSMVDPAAEQLLTSDRLRRDAHNTPEL